MKYSFKSVFSYEVDQYLKLLTAAGRYIDRIQSSLRSLDKYLVDCCLSQKNLDASVISDWMRTRDVSSRTKAKDISHTRGFVKYLNSLGFIADCPDLPKTQSDYVPYIFSDYELERLFSAADNFQARTKLTRSALIFPVLLRLLYGCGLRLGEGRTLLWRDVDLESGVITVKEAKNQKQRFVPMSESTTMLLKNYRTMTRSDGICTYYLFESSDCHDEPYRNNTFSVWFAKILVAAGILYTKRHPRERGPCPHCIRHCFTQKSFLKSESEGRRFEEAAPYLAAYLGHDSPIETEAYLSSNHSVYTESHRRVDSAIGNLFPEVSFDEE